MGEDLRFLKETLQEVWGRLDRFERMCVVAWIVGLIAVVSPQVPTTRLVVGLAYAPLIVALVYGAVRRDKEVFWASMKSVLFAGLTVFALLAVINWLLPAMLP